jgi:Tol biopolymer transport system component
LSDADGRNARQLTFMANSLTGSPTWSPDGKRIAFDSRPEGQPEIFVMNIDGTNLERLTDEPREDVVPRWSRDGKWVYFGSNRSGSWQLWKIPPDGGKPVQITKMGGFAALEGPDDEWIYYARGRSVSGLWRVRPDGTGEELVTDQLRAGCWGHWTPSSAGIYFGDRQTDGTWALFLLPHGRREAHRIAFFDKPLIEADSGFAMFPGERAMLFTQIDQSGSDILVMENPVLH